MCGHRTRAFVVKKAHVLTICWTKITSWIEKTWSEKASKISDIQVITALWAWIKDLNRENLKNSDIQVITAAVSVWIKLNDRRQAQHEAFAQERCGSSVCSGIRRHSCTREGAITTALNRLVMLRHGSTPKTDTPRLGYWTQTIHSESKVRLSSVKSTLIYLSMCMSAVQCTIHLIELKADVLKTIL